jgi:hypothetical protein
MIRQRLIHVILVILLTLTNSSFSSYSIDDGILFRLNFQPSEKSGTDASSTEKSSIPADESLLGMNPSDDFETVLISTGRNEKYHCSLPKSDSKAVKVNKLLFCQNHIKSHTYFVCLFCLNFTNCQHIIIDPSPTDVTSPVLT